MSRFIAALAFGATVLVGTAPAALAEARPNQELDPNPIALERVELTCRKAVVTVTIRDEEHRKPVIGCKWSQSEHPRFGGYKLVRKIDDHPREVIFRTRDRERTRAIDARVRRQHEYTYRIVVVNDHGKVIGLSNKAVVTT